MSTEEHELHTHILETEAPHEKIKAGLEALSMESEERILRSLGSDSEKFPEEEPADEVHKRTKEREIPIMTVDPEIELETESELKLSEEEPVSEPESEEFSPPIELETESELKLSKEEPVSEPESEEFFPPIETESELKLSNVDISTAEIEKIISEDGMRDIIAKLKENLAGKEGGGKEVLQEGIIKVLEKYFEDNKIFPEEKKTELKNKITELAGNISNNIEQDLNQSLELHAIEKVGFIKDIFNKFSKKTKKEMAATIAVGLGIGLTASFFLPASALAIAGIGVGAGAVRGAMGLYFRLRRLKNKKAAAEEFEDLKSKKQKSINKEKSKILKDGIEETHTKTGKARLFLSRQDLARVISNNIRLETSQDIIKHGLFDEKGKMVESAEKVLWGNIKDHVEADPKYKDLGPEEKQKEIQILFATYAEELFQQKNMVDLGGNSKAMGVIKKYQEITAISNAEIIKLSPKDRKKIVDSLSKTTSVELDKLKNFLVHLGIDNAEALISDMESIGIIGEKSEDGLCKLDQAKLKNIEAETGPSAKNIMVSMGLAAAIAGGMRFAYQSKYIRAGITGAGMAAAGYMWAGRKEKQAVIKEFYDSIGQAIEKAERVIANNKISEKTELDEKNLKFLGDKRSEIRTLLSLTTKDASGHDTPLLQDPILRAQAENFIYETNRFLAEQTKPEERITTPEGEKFDNLIENLSQQLDQDQAEVMADVEKKIKKKQALYNLKKFGFTAVGAAVGSVVGFKYYDAVASMKKMIGVETKPGAVTSVGSGNAHEEALKNSELLLGVDSFDADGVSGTDFSKLADIIQGKTAATPDQIKLAKDIMNQWQADNKLDPDQIQALSNLKSIDTGSDNIANDTPPSDQVVDQTPIRATTASPDKADPNSIPEIAKIKAGSGRGATYAIYDQLKADKAKYGVQGLTDEQLRLKARDIAAAKGIIEMKNGKIISEIRSKGGDAYIIDSKDGGKTITVDQYDSTTGEKLSTTTADQSHDYTETDQSKFQYAKKTAAAAAEPAQIGKNIPAVDQSTQPGTFEPASESGPDYDVDFHQFVDSMRTGQIKGQAAFDRFTGIMQKHPDLSPHQSKIFALVMSGDGNLSDKFSPGRAWASFDKIKNINDFDDLVKQFDQLKIKTDLPKGELWEPREIYINGEKYLVAARMDGKKVEYAFAPGQTEKPISSKDFIKAMDPKKGIISEAPPKPEVPIETPDTKVEPPADMPIKEQPVYVQDQTEIMPVKGKTSQFVMSENGQEKFRLQGLTKDADPTKHNSYFEYTPVDQPENKGIIMFYQKADGTIANRLLSYKDLTKSALALGKNEIPADLYDKIHANGFKMDQDTAKQVMTSLANKDKTLADMVDQANQAKSSTTDTATKTTAEKQLRPTSARADSAIDELERTNQAFQRFYDKNIPFEEKIAALKEIMPNDGDSVKHNGIKFYRYGDNIHYENQKGATIGIDEREANHLIKNKSMADNAIAAQKKANLEGSKPADIPLKEALPNADLDRLETSLKKVGIDLSKLNEYKSNKRELAQIIVNLNDKYNQAVVADNTAEAADFAYAKEKVTEFMNKDWEVPQKPTPIRTTVPAPEKTTAPNPEATTKPDNVLDMDKNSSNSEPDLEYHNTPEVNTEIRNLINKNFLSGSNAEANIKLLTATGLEEADIKQALVTLSKPDTLSNIDNIIKGTSLDNSRQLMVLNELVGVLNKGETTPELNALANHLEQAIEDSYRQAM